MHERARVRNSFIHSFFWTRTFAKTFPTTNHLGRKTGVQYSTGTIQFLLWACNKQTMKMFLACRSYDSASDDHNLVKSSIDGWLVGERVESNAACAVRTRWARASSAARGGISGSHGLRSYSQGLLSNDHGLCGSRFHCLKNTPFRADFRLSCATWTVVETAIK